MGPEMSSGAQAGWPEFIIRIWKWLSPAGQPASAIRLSAGWGKRARSVGFLDCAPRRLVDFLPEISGVANLEKGRGCTRHRAGTGSRLGRLLSRAYADFPTNTHQRIALANPSVQRETSPLAQIQRPMSNSSCVMPSSLLGSSQHYPETLSTLRS